MITTLLLLAAMGQAVPPDCNIATCPCTYSGTPSVPTSATVEIVAIGDLHCKDNQHIEGDGKSKEGNHCVDDPPRMQCPKYEHFDRSIADLCGAMEPAFRKKQAVCNTYPREGCVPDLHWVTEKEWQELQERLKKLEDPCSKIPTGSCTLSGTGR